MYGIYIIQGKNPGWLMEDIENPALWKTKREAEDFIRDWIIHKKNYEVRNFANTTTNKRTCNEKSSTQESHISDIQKK
jgi:hypothetical protein